MGKQINKNLKDLVDALKSDSRFRILEDARPYGFGDGVDYWEFTTLESRNLKIIYGEEILCGSAYENEITLTDKRKNVHVFCNSEYVRDKPIIRRSFTIEHLREYIEGNTQ